MRFYALTFALSLGCLEQQEPLFRGSGTVTLAQWAGSVVVYDPGEATGVSCLEKDCANALATGPADGQSVGIGGLGRIVLLFEESPVLEVPNDDLVLYVQIPPEANAIVEVSDGGADFEVVPPKTMTPDGATVGVDFGPTGLGEATLLHLTNIGSGTILLDAVQSLTPEALAAPAEGQAS